MPSLLKRLYVQRGIRSPSELDRSVRSLLTYHQLPNIDQAVDLLMKAITNQYKLLVVGDFDVDGATSTALVVLALQKLGANTVYFLVPNRFNQDYGLSPDIVERASELGVQMIVTVDNGISSHSGVLSANQKGIAVLITDHHIPSETLPAADAIVNPNLRGCHFESKCLAGVGVAFYLMLALRSRLDQNGWFLKKNILAPKLADFLDLVALGTVADVVPMDSNNRILVYQGLSRIRAGRCRPGILALAEVAKIESARICTSDIGFALGPRINAVGRLDDMSVGVSLLLTEDLSLARMIASKLDSLNKKRRKIEQAMEIEALKLCRNIAKDTGDIPGGLILYHSEWHHGVVGILASRVKERYQRPVIAFAPIGNGILKGSGRSVTGLNICNMLEYLDTLYPGMILKFGGHAMAVGVTLEQNKLERFRKKFSALVKEWRSPQMLHRSIWSDGELTVQDLSLTTAELIRDGGPWGETFPEPIFDGIFSVMNQSLVGKKHYKLMLKPIEGGPLLEGMIFHPHFLPDSSIQTHTVKLAYKLVVNEFLGHRKLQILIEYLWIL